MAYLDNTGLARLCANIKAKFDLLVPNTRTVNGKALSANITLAASDVSAVPTTRAVNGKALSANISLTAADVGAAAGSHAHGSITNAGKIGTTPDLPVFTGTGGALGAKSKADAKIALDINSRGFEYGGREIPFTWAQIRAKVAAGDFLGLRVGDYKDITLNGTFNDPAVYVNKTVSNEVVRMEIAGIDSYYRQSDVPAPHHIDFISRDCFSLPLQYNGAATNSGSYLGSSLFVTLNGQNGGGIQALLPADVRAVVISKRANFEVKTAATVSGSVWADMGKLWLPTEAEVYGCVIFCEQGHGVGPFVHYPIFRDGCRHIIKNKGNSGERMGWWCAASVLGSTTQFCRATHNGDSYPAVANSTAIGVPICFRVA